MRRYSLLLAAWSLLLAASAMGRVREYLHPYRAYLKWLRQVARWQMHAPLPIRAAIKRRVALWVNALTLEAGEEVGWTFPGTSLHYLLDLSEGIQFDMFYTGAFQPETHRLFVQQMRPDRVFVDAGAHVGQYTLWAADYYRQHAPPARPAQPLVLAFEPHPATFRRLQHNIALNGLEPWVKAQSVALSNQPGVVPFHLASDAQTGCSSLAVQPDWWPATQGGRTILVQALALDEYLHRYPPALPIGLIKFDIEGAELLALRGAAATLTTYRPVLILEACQMWMGPFGYTYQDLRAFLTGAGYSIFVICSDATLVSDTLISMSETETYDLICFPVQV